MPKLFIKNFANRHGFSLIELAVVILIIGILVAGILTANGLIKKTKISAAQSLTKSSPIAGITGNVLWLESSLEASFKDSESSSGDAITSWYDQKSSVNKSLVVAAGTGPIYSNTINYIHAVKFLGSSANYLKVEDASFLNDTDYTIVVLEKRQSASAGYFIGDSSNSNSNPNQNLLLGYKNDGTIDHSQGAENSYASNISTYSSSGETPRVFTFVSDSINGKKTYINGILAAQSSDTTKLSNITTLAIGKGYTGEIGEIAIFTRALKTDERKATEDYLGKKYSVKVNRSTTASSSCINGIVTADGCKMDCSTSSIVGLSSPSSVLDGASNITGTCAATGYVGTLTLSCPAGTGKISASGSCGCDSNYFPDGNGICKAAIGCAISATGIATTNVAHGASGSITCGGIYSGTINYNCSNGNPGIVGTCTLSIPSNVTAPALSSASVTVGTPISVTNGTWSPTPNSYSYSWWWADGTPTPISGATSSSYTPVASDAGHTLLCKVIANGSGGSSLAASSNTSLAVALVSGPCTCTNCSTIIVSRLNSDNTTSLSKIHKFTTVGSAKLTCPIGKKIWILVVGGGGGSSGMNGPYRGSGGGAGGYIENTDYIVSDSSINIVVGDGGAGATSPYTQNGANGQNSSLGSIIAYGGGGAGAPGSNGSSGGSGGGGGSGTSVGLGGTSSQGNNGGDSTIIAPCKGGGGGGGAGGGQTSLGTHTAVGGTGKSSSISGVSTIYAAGGASNTISGGGNAGCILGPVPTGGANYDKGGTNNTGGGAGGGTNSFKGGSGVVIVSYTN